MREQKNNKKREEEDEREIEKRDNRGGRKWREGVRNKEFSLLPKASNRRGGEEIQIVMSKTLIKSLKHELLN
jgi:hypothetical protein